MQVGLLVAEQGEMPFAVTLLVALSSTTALFVVAVVEVEQVALEAMAAMVAKVEPQAHLVVAVLTVAIHAIAKPQELAVTLVALV